MPVREDASGNEIANPIATAMHGELEMLGRLPRSRRGDRRPNPTGTARRSRGDLLGDPLEREDARVALALGHDDGHLGPRGHDRVERLAERAPR